MDLLTHPSLMKASASSILFRALALWGLFLILYSCSGSDDSPEPEGDLLISATIDGTAWEATSHNAYITVWPDVGQQFTLEAFNDVYKINLWILEMGPSDGTMTEKTYSDPDYNDFIFYYAMENGDFIAEHNEKQDFESVPDIKINITSSTSERISGTFSGTFYKTASLTGMDTPAVVVIKDGIFRNVPVIYE